MLLRVRHRLALAVLLALAAAAIALADEDALVRRLGDYRDPNAGENLAEPDQPQAPPSATPPTPLRGETPCHFGPITKRITRDDLGWIIAESPTPRAAWKFILARPEDERAEPLGFAISAPDDGLGDGLVCPDDTPFLTAVGYSLGAAEGCKVPADEANALSEGMARAIDAGKYGDPIQAQIQRQNAGLKGALDAAYGKADCAKVADSIRDYSRELLKP